MYTGHKKTYDNLEWRAL